MKERRRVFVLIKKHLVVAVFGSMRKLCDAASEKDKNFPSYWTLARKKEDVIEVGDYSIHKVKLH